MQVSEPAGGGNCDHQGKAYFFCGPACRSQFEKNPERDTAK